MAENIAEVLVAVQADVKNAVTEITNLKKDLTDTIKAGKSFDSFFEKLDKTLARFNVITEGSTAELSDLVKGLTSTTTAVNSLSSKLGELATKGGKNIATLANSSNSLEKSIRDAAAQANRFNTGNILAQIQDIGVTAAMNMNPMTIALQQGTQLLYVFQQSKAPIAEFVAALKSMFSPLSLLTIGLTGLIAAGIQMTNWVSVGKTALNGLASAFDWIAENTTKLTTALVGFIALNSVTIINSFSKAVITLSNSLLVATANTLKFIGAWIVSNPLGAIVVGLTAIISVLNELGYVSKDTFNKFIGYTLAAGYAIGGIFDAIAQGFTKGFDKSFEDYKNKLSEIVNEDYLGKLDKTVKTVSKAASDGLKSMAEGLGKNTKDAEKLQKAIEKVGEAYENAIFSNQTKIEDLKFTESTRGMTDEEKIVAKINREYEKQLNNLERKAQAENLSLKYFDEYKDKLEKQKQERIDIELQTYKNEEAQKAWNSAMDYGSSLTKSFFSELKSGLQEGQSAWEAFTNAILKMLDKIADKMMDLALDAAFDSLKQSGTGKSNNLMSSIVDWTSTAVMSAFGYENMGGIKGSVNPASADFASTVGIKPAIPAAQGGVFSNGIYSSPTMFKFAKGGKFGVMGEAGPEAVMPLQRSPDGSLGVRADGIGGGSPVVVNVINNSNARATTQQRQTEQGTTIDVMIDELVAQKLGQQGSASNQALTAFNNRQLVAR